MSLFSWTRSSKKLHTHVKFWKRRQKKQHQGPRRNLLVERLDERAVLSALVGTPNPNESVTTGFAADQLAAALVGPGVSISNAKFTGNTAQNGSFTFNDKAVVGFGQGIILSSGNAADVVGPNTADSTSSTFPPTGEVWGPGDADLTALSGFPTYDATVLEFDFVPTANQVVFNYAFASDEYPEWVNTPFNDVFAFYVNGSNYATVRQVAGDPSSPFVPVAVNNINNGNPDFYPDFTPMRPDLFRPNYYNPNGPSAIDLEQDGITTVLTFQAPVHPGVVNHMKLAIADASDGIYDSAVFIQAGSLVSNKNPVADLSLLPETGQAPLAVTAFVEGEDPDHAALNYKIAWGDGAVSDWQPLTDTAKVNHTYTSPGEYLVTLTVSNGTLSGTSTEDVKVLGTGSVALDTFINSKPSDPSNDLTPSFTFGSTPAGSTFEYSLDGGAFLACSSNLTITNPLVNGTHKIDVRATNGGATDATPATYTWTIDTTISDTTAPETTIVTKPANPSNETSPTFKFASTDPEADLEYSLDGMDWEGTSGVLTLSSLTDGEHTILVRSIDAANNADPTPASYTWTVDTALPVTTISGQPVSLSNDPTPVFSFDSSEPNVIFTCSIDGSSFVPGKSGIPLAPLADGNHTFALRATDASGNVGPVASYSWQIDTVAPPAPGIALMHDSGSSQVDRVTNDAALNVSGQEANAKVEYSLNGVTWTSGFAAKEGANSVQVRQTDLAGNVSAAAALSFTLDTTPPQLSPAFSSPPPFVVGAKGITVSPNATDASGIASQSAGQVDTSTAGQKSLICSATDVAGNSASLSVSYSVVAKPAAQYHIVSVLPSYVFPKQIHTIPVLFQLRDANNRLISDQMAAKLLTGITITFDGVQLGKIQYHKELNLFSATLKIGKPAKGMHELAIHLAVNGTEVTTLKMPVKIV